MNELRWTNPSLPQTLQIAIFLLYIDAFFMVLGGGISTVFGLVLTAAFVAGGIGIASEKKWGYGIAIAGAVVQVLLLVSYAGLFSFLDDVGLLIEFMVDIALVALLVHPLSRNYQRIWFR